MKTMTERKDDAPGLDAFFDAARQAPPEPTADFMSRMTEAALDAQIAQSARRRAAAPQGAGLWRQLGQALGGWPGLAGLAAVCVAGLWLGVSLPAGLSDLLDPDAAAGLGTLGLDPVSAYDVAMMEG